MMIIALHMALMSACAPVTVPLADGYDLVETVPLAWDDDLGMQVGLVTGPGCEAEVLLTASTRDL